MVGRRVDEREQRLPAAFAFHQLKSLAKIEPVRLKRPGPEIVRVKELLDSRRGLELPGAAEPAPHRVHAESPVAALRQDPRQAPHDPACGDLGHEIGKPAEAFDREPGQHVVFGVPARTACPLHQQRPRLAVERLEVVPIARPDIDAGHTGDIEAAFVKNHHNVRTRAGGRASMVRGRGQLVSRADVRFQIAAGVEIVDAGEARSRELRNEIVGVEFLVKVVGHRQRQRSQSNEAD